MNRNTLIALGSGGISALISLSFMMGSVLGLFFAYIAPLPLFMVGLSLGTTMATIAGIVGIVIAGAVGGYLAAAGFCLVNALPAWIAIRQAMHYRTLADGTIQWRPLGHALSGLAAFGMICLICGALLALSNAESFEGVVAAYLATAVNAMFAGLSENEVEPVVAALIPMFPGIVAASWFVMVVINGVIAQSILKRAGRNARPNEWIGDLRLPEWMSWILIGAAFVALIGSGDLQYLARNCVIVAAIPFLFVGLAVVHTFARKTPFAKGLLVAFYFILIISGWAVFLVAGLGMLEQWADVSRRLGGPRNGQEKN